MKLSTSDAPSMDWELEARPAGARRNLEGTGVPVRTTVAANLPLTKPGPQFAPLKEHLTPVILREFFGRSTMGNKLL